MLLGIIVLTIGIMAFVYSSKSLSNQLKKNSRQSKFNSYQPYLSLAIIILGGYLIIYHYLSIALLLLCVLLSISLTLIHASMRLRNLKNKINNKVGNVGSILGAKKTPMAIILQTINVQSEDFLN
jgi:hypothetical protein